MGTPNFLVLMKVAIVIHGTYTGSIKIMFYDYSEGGFFKAHLNFPKEYPLRPPKMKFVTEIWHPNSK